MNEPLSKLVGYVNNKVAEDLNLYNQIWKPIKLTQPLFEHIAKHSNEYKDVDSCIYTLSNLSDIISSPDFVFHNKKIIQ